MCERAYKSIALGCIMDSHYDTLHCNEIATYAQSICQFEIFWPCSIYFEFSQKVLTKGGLISESFHFVSNLPNDYLTILDRIVSWHLFLEIWVNVKKHSEIEPPSGMLKYANLLTKLWLLYHNQKHLIASRIQNIPQ